MVLRHPAFILPFALLVGCGGNSGNRGSTGEDPTVVTFTFSGPAPVAAAARVGTGAFHQATLSSNVLNLSVPSGTMDFAVAYVCPPYIFSGSTFQRQFVFEASVEDGTSFSQSCANPNNASSAPQGTLSGTVDASAIAGANMVWLQGNGSGTGIGATVANVSTELPVGNDNVAALATENTYSGTTVSITVLAVKDLGEQTVPGVVNGGNPIVLSAADETTMQPITYDNAPSGLPLFTSVSFITDAGTAIPMQSGTSASYPAVPPTMLQGKAQYWAISAAGDFQTSSVRYSEVWNNSGKPLNVVFPSAWTYTGPSAAALPIFDFSTYSGFTGTAGVTHVATENWRTTSSFNTYQVTVSARFQGGQATVAMPDLSPLTGFLPALSAGTGVAWRASINQNSAHAIGSNPVNSSTETVENVGQFVVP